MMIQNLPVGSAYTRQMLVEKVPSAESEDLLIGDAQDSEPGAAKDVSVVTGRQGPRRRRESFAV